jgi:hypothetical protein
VVLVIDPARPEVEKELEQLYINFAQANRLTTKQCMVVAVARQDHPGSWGGEGRCSSCIQEVMVNASASTSIAPSANAVHKAVASAPAPAAQH